MFNARLEGDGIMIINKWVISILVVCALLVIRVSVFAFGRYDGVAVVSNVEGNTGLNLPAIKDLYRNPDRITQVYRARGYRVAADPSGQCISVTLTPHVSDAALSSEAASEYLLAAGIVEDVTTSQLSNRSMGYISIDVLTKEQQELVYRIAQRHNLIDEKGQPTTVGGRLKVGLWPFWVVHVTLNGKEQTICCKTNAQFRAPSEVVVTKKPLSGSLLWYSWRYAASSWGNERISVKAGTYTINELLKQISAAGKCGISAAESAGKLKLNVVAENIQIRKLIWAIGVATGLQAAKASGSKNPSVMMSFVESAQPHIQSNLLHPLNGHGYYLLPDTEVVRKLMNEHSGGSLPYGKWLGWNLSDLPALYRQAAIDEWPNAYKAWTREACWKEYAPIPKVSDLHPESARMLWTRAILVSIKLESPQGGGTLVEFPLISL